MRPFEPPGKLIDIGGHRPGCGLSDPLPKKTFTDWAKDVEALAQSLDLDHFHVAGESGGGPFALAVAIHLQDRVTSVTLVSSATPPDLPRFREGMAFINRTGSLITRYAPKFILRIGLNRYGHMVKTRTRQVGKQLETQLCAWIGKLSQAGEMRIVSGERVLDLREGFRRGSDGVLNDTILVLRPWRLDHRPDLFDLKFNSPDSQ
jgi:pimeloyl-ACP methyl ester carboxylesterase